MISAKEGKAGTVEILAEVAVKIFESYDAPLQDGGLPLYLPGEKGWAKLMQRVGVKEHKAQVGSNLFNEIGEALANPKDLCKTS